MLLSMKQQKTLLPRVAIVGRPNVGKSALFNRICKKRIAIVDEAEGITRDRLYADADFFGKPFQIIDTGGIDEHSIEAYQEEIRNQARIAIEEADSIIMVVDATVGITPLDQELAQRLHRTKKPLCLAVNKVDLHTNEALKYEFMGLGIGRMISVSAAQGWHIAELLDVALSDVEEPTAETQEESIRTAIVGKPNVGKSSLLNYLLGEARAIVSPVPGTTRDSIDAMVEEEGHLFTFIDTAGIRRKRAEHEVVDKFASIRTERAIARSDVCVLLIDATEGVTSQDKKIANLIHELKKGCVILVNKWDLVKGILMEHCLRGIREEMPFLAHCPIHVISAVSGRNVDKIFATLIEVYQNVRTRITTHTLNTFVEAAIMRNHPPMIKGKRLRIYYMTQVSVEPPQFVLFVNKPELMNPSYLRYLMNQFRDQFGLIGAPIFFYLKGKKVRERSGMPTPKQQEVWRRQVEENEDGLDENGFELLQDGDPL